MTDRDEADPVVLRYLLGELPAEEEAALDERSFVDDAWEEERAKAADDLIDAYLIGALSGDRRERFETRFLASSEHRERFRLLRDLRAVIGRVEPATDVPRVWPGAVWALAAALLVAIAAVLLLMRTPAPNDPRIARGPTVEPARTPAPLPTVTPSTAQAVTTAEVSLPDRPRAMRIALDATVRAVRFTIPLPKKGAALYTAKLRRGGRTVWEEGDLDAPDSGAPLVVEVPARVLGDGEAALAIEPDVTRSGAPPPSAARVWPLRLVRR